MPKGQLLKRWNDWSAGVGHLIDDGRTPGMYTATALLGLRGELRPAPFQNVVTVAVDPGQHYQYFFEEDVTSVQVPAADADTSSSTTNSTTLSWSQSNGTQTNLMLLVGILATDRPSSVTYDGTAMLNLPIATGSISVGSTPRTLSVWYLLGPSTGSNTALATFSESQATIIGISASFFRCDQTNPFGVIVTDAKTSDAGPARSTITSNTNELCVDFAATATAQTMTVVAGQTDLENVLETNRLTCSVENGAASVVMDWTLGASGDWGAIGIPLVGVQRGYLYAQRGSKGGTSSTVKVNKVSLAKDNFANLETGQHDLTPLVIPGQPVRHSGTNTGGLWYFPMGDNEKTRELTTIGIGAVSNDTLAAGGTALGADHYAALGSQAVSALAHSSNDDGGLRILKVGGNVDVEADWGPAFGGGDRAERAGGLISLGGASFVLGVDGLYSFDKGARSRLIFEDFRAWRHVFDNISIVSYKGGLAFSHPTGLIFYEPGKLPINIGLNADVGGSSLIPSGPGELRGGRYHGLAVAGDFLWTIYQPDINSKTVNVLVGYPAGATPPEGMIWQQIGTTLLQDTDHMLGCFVSVSSRPLSAAHVTPVLWYGNDNDLEHVVLNTTGSPFRNRADTHKLPITGDAYMSELRFVEPVDLTEIIVSTSPDMVSGDEWQISLLTNGTGDDIDVGPPCRGAAARHRRVIDRAKGGKNVTSLILRVNWTATSTANRVPPVIQAIELFGLPSIGEVAE